LSAKNKVLSLQLFLTLLCKTVFIWGTESGKNRGRRVALTVLCRN